MRSEPTRQSRHQSGPEHRKAKTSTTGWRRPPNHCDRQTTAFHIMLPSLHGLGCSKWATAASMGATGEIDMQPTAPSPRRRLSSRLNLCIG